MTGDVSGDAWSLLLPPSLDILMPDKYQDYTQASKDGQAHMDREALARMAKIPELELDKINGVPIDQSDMFKLAARDLETLREHCFTLVKEHSADSLGLSKQLRQAQLNEDTLRNQVTGLGQRVEVLTAEANMYKLKFEIEIARYDKLIDQLLEKQRQY